MTLFVTALVTGIGLGAMYGLIETAGRNVAGWSMHATARLGIARTYQAMCLYSALSAEDNVIAGLPHGRRGARSLVGFEGDPGTPANDLPNVDRRLVEFARALAMRPHVLLLDEPAAG